MKKILNYFNFFVHLFGQIKEKVKEINFYRLRYCCMEFEIRYYFNEELLHAKRVCFKEAVEVKNKSDALDIANRRVNHSAFNFTCYELVELVN